MLAYVLGSERATGPGHGSGSTESLGPNRSLPEGYHDCWDDLAKRWAALFVAKNFVEAMLLLANAVSIVNLGFLLRQPSW